MHDDRATWLYKPEKLKMTGEKFSRIGKEKCKASRKQEESLKLGKNSSKCSEIRSKKMENLFSRYTEPLVDLSNRARIAHVRDNRNGFQLDFSSL